VRDKRSTVDALEQYLLLRYRLVSPPGLWDGKCWRPIPLETRECCLKVPEPGEQQPWPAMRHCRSSEHVYHLHQLSCSLPEFKLLCREAIAKWWAYAAVSNEVAQQLRRLSRKVAMDTCLENAPAYAVESVLL